MALADITINDGLSTPVAHTFTYIGTENNKVVRANFAAPAEEPERLTIGHQSKVVSGNKVLSDLVRIDKTILDADNVTALVMNQRLMSDCPIRVYSDELADTLAGLWRNLLTNAWMRSFMKGSVG